MQNQLNSHIDNDILHIELPEEFDSFKVDRVRDHLDAIAADESLSVSLDFQNNQFIDSSGIGAIVFLFKRLRAKKRHLVLSNVSGQPLKLMTMLHVDRAIPVNRNILHVSL